MVLISLLKKKDVIWIDYNIFLLDVKLNNYNKTFSNAVVILFSLLFAMIYALISNRIKSDKDTRKKTK